MIRTRVAAILLPLLMMAPPQALADPFDAALRASAEGRHSDAAAAFHVLALGGDGAAAYNLALLFATGRGIPQNDTEALYWAWRARLADVQAASALLARLWPPFDTDRRNDIASRLERDVLPLAKAGNGSAMLQLAAIQSVVRDTPDLVSAHTWQSIAAALDVPGAVAARDATLAALPAADRALAQDQALAAFAVWCESQHLARPATCGILSASSEKPPEAG